MTATRPGAKTLERHGRHTAATQAGAAVRLGQPRNHLRPWSCPVHAANAHVSTQRDLALVFQQFFLVPHAPLLSMHGPTNRAYLVTKGRFAIQSRLQPRKDIVSSCAIMRICLSDCGALLTSGCTVSGKQQSGAVAVSPAVHAVARTCGPLGHPSNRDIQPLRAHDAGPMQDPTGSV